MAHVEHELELHPGSRKRVRRRQVRITTTAGEVLELEGREIGSIPLGLLPDHFSESDPEQMAAAQKAARWFEQHMVFALGAERGIGFVEHCVAPGCRRHGIEPTEFPYFDPSTAGGRGGDCREGLKALSGNASASTGTPADSVT